MASSDEFAGRAPMPATQPANDTFDISSLGQPAEADELGHFLDHVPIAIVVFKTLAGDPRVVYANKTFEILFGQSFADLRGRGVSVWAHMVHEDNPELTLVEALRAGDDFVGTYTLDRPRHALLEVYTTVIEKDDDTPNYRIVALINVTERERAQREEFARQLRDKETLLMELQHRVKNNLQLVTALVRLEARSSRQGHDVNLEKLAGRIEALRLLYRDITADGVGKTVDLGHYISEIATALINAYAVGGIRLDLKVEYTPASVNVAMPVGLIVNELITNAFKYAFAGKQNGTIAVSCVRAGPTAYKVVVSDNGAGLPEGVNWPVPGKIGSLVVQTLRENAKTDVSVESAPHQGTTVTLQFEHPVPARTAN